MPTRLTSAQHRRLTRARTALDAREQQRRKLIAQRNKARAVLPWVELIHSVDSLRLAEEIDTQAGKLGRNIPILLEVNAAEETSKHGVAVAATTHLANFRSSQSVCR